MEKTDDAEMVRPSKKQRELLTYIESFITEHGYSPSYREIMNGCSYNSVATVSLHVNSLIKRGHINKRDRSARSLEVVSSDGAAANVTAPAVKQENWLTEQVEKFFKDTEKTAELVPETIQKLQTLIAAMAVLGMDDMAAEFTKRLDALQNTGTPDMAEAPTR
jgi:SOS-response transcriptional repressor LexA